MVSASLRSARDSETRYAISRPRTVFATVWKLRAERLRFLREAMCTGLDNSGATQGSLRARQSIAPIRRSRTRHGSFAKTSTGSGSSGRITLIGCPKLDEGDYSEKLTAIITENDIREAVIARMEVPCRGGLRRAAENARKAGGKFIPQRVVTISGDGGILE